jgi:hypothetical protein
LPFVKKKEAVVVNQCPCIIAVWLYASFLNKGMAAFMQGAERQQCFFEKTPASLSRLAGFLESWLCFTMGNKSNI